MFKKIVLISLCLIAKLTYADGVQALDKFLQNKTISADFTQTVYGNKKNKVSQGNMQIERPNKFRWHYVQDGQLIISDSKNIYIYDQPLQQVTQRKLTSSLGKSPALLLAGGTDIKKYYDIVPEADSSNLQWVKLTPKNANENNGFKTVEMAFAKDTQMLSQMKFTDSFDNKSMISFANVKVGLKFPAATFSFTPPAGVDVIKSERSYV